MLYLHQENNTKDIQTMTTATYTAVIRYEAECGYDKGDYWTAPCSWVERDEVAVEVYTEDGDDAEAAEWLKNMLN